MNSPASAEIQSTINGLAGRLIAEGILSNDQARDAEQDARSMGVSLVRYLIDTLDVDSGELAEMASAEFGVPVFDLRCHEPRDAPRAADRCRAHGQAPCGTALSPRTPFVCRRI